MTINGANFTVTADTLCNDGSVEKHFTGGAPSGWSLGALGSGGSATELFALEYSGSDFLYQGAQNAHPGGGYFFLDGGGMGVEPNGTNMSIVDVTDDPLFPDTQKAFRNTYYADGLTPAAGVHVIYLNWPDTPKFYVRTRIRFSANWEFGDDQLKFAKNKNSGGNEGLTSNTWFDDNGYLALTDSNNYYLFADWWGDPNNPARIEDDINNGFGAGATDANWTPTPNQWYWLEYEIDAVGPNNPNGSYRVWIDGQLYIEKTNYNVSIGSNDSMFNRSEFGGHVWQSGAPSQDIYLEFHNLSVFSERPGVPEGL